MNIFVLHKNPEIAAKYHNDRHCVKMILETAQLLCTVHWLNNSSAPYKKTHINHPCSIWSRESLSNYNWLCSLGKSLCKEYTFRYGRIHKSESVIDFCIENIPNIKDKGLTKFALAMPDEHKINKGESPILCYRHYYKFGKSHLIKYTKRNVPSFIK